MIPQEISIFFWDIDTNTFKPTDYPDYTIFRILELGDENAIRWLREIFSSDEIKRIIRTQKRLSRKSANYWALVYNIPREEVAAFSYQDPFPL